MIHLYVDDVRDCPVGFTLARTYEEALHYLTTQPIDILSLDHDLGEDTYGHIAPTGYDLVKRMCEQGIAVRHIYLHTANPVGRDNMYETLKAAQRREFIPMTTTINRIPPPKSVLQQIKAQHNQHRK